MTPPTARKQPKTITQHGETRIDDYAWLRDKENPEVAAYLHAENAYTDSILGPLKPLQDKLYEEMLSHIKQTDENVPYREGDWLYISKTEEGKQYPILARMRDGLNAEEVYFDLNAAAVGHPFYAFGPTAVSPDGNLFLYSEDTTGFRQYELHVKDLRTGEILPDTARKVGSAAWASDNRTYFYTVEDPAKRQYRLYRHRLGESGGDTLIYEETDERFNVGVNRSRSGEILFLTSGSHTASEVRFLRADEPTGDWILIAPRETDHEYYADHHGDRFFIRTNTGGRNFRLVTAPVASPGIQNWEELIPHRPDVMLERVEVFRDFYVLIERFNGLPRLRVADLGGGDTHEIAFPEPTYSAAPEVNRDWTTLFFRYAYQSLVTPRSIFDYNVHHHHSILKKQTEVPGGFDRANYRSERIFATAAEGTRVPISLVYRAGVERNGAAPLFLQAYGSYGFPYPVTFSAARLTLLDRGVVVAIAHIRGGGEMGKAWHDDGRMMNKLNTFTDFIAAGEHLIAEGYCAKDRLAIYGGSAGGLLMGAVSNMRPDLFKAVVSDVPFVDVINTMSDASLPLTVGEYEEWGNPAKPDEYAYMRVYSPYENLEAKSYPATLVKTSFNDSQVMYWEPAKYVARLRTLKIDSNPLLLKTNMDAGHGGASGRYDALKELAEEFAFLLWQLGVEG
jgi:oligopeptidase B